MEGVVSQPMACLPPAEETAPTVLPLREEAAPDPAPEAEDLLYDIKCSLFVL